MYYVLDSIVKIDQRLRFEIAQKELTELKKDSLHEAIEIIQILGVKTLQDFILRTGEIPTISTVGKRGETNAWILAQHADSHIDFQKRYLKMMKEAQPSEIRMSNIPYLEDRILMNEGKPQKYGTQIGYEIEDAANVDKRRAEYGLGTLEDYLRTHGIKIPD